MGRDVRICTFNAKHIVDVPEYAHHVENCPDRRQVDRVIMDKLTECKDPSGRIAAASAPASVVVCLLYCLRCT